MSTVPARSLAGTGPLGFSQARLNPKPCKSLPAKPGYVLNPAKACQAPKQLQHDAMQPTLSMLTWGPQSLNPKSLYPDRASRLPEHMSLCPDSRPQLIRPDPKALGLATLSAPKLC